jgi:GrpB-like predicted nucleotidyltransferase (UPF0157 family)
MYIGDHLRSCQTLPELIAHYKELKSIYHTQLQNLINHNIDDKERWLATSYRRLVECGKMLEGLGVDIEQFNKPYENS